MTSTSSWEFNLFIGHKDRLRPRLCQTHNQSPKYILHKCITCILNLTIAADIYMYLYFGFNFYSDKRKIKSVRWIFNLFFDSHSLFVVDWFKATVKIFVGSSCSKHFNSFKNRILIGSNEVVFLNSQSQKPFTFFWWEEPWIYGRTSVFKGKRCNEWLHLTN